MHTIRQDLDWKLLNARNKTIINHKEKIRGGGGGYVTTNALLFKLDPQTVAHYRSNKFTGVTVRLSNSTTLR